MFSIVIPTFDNFKYLKLTIESIKKNSDFNNEIIIHVNGNDIKIISYLENNKIIYTKSDTNLGLCKSVNIAAKKASTNYILYSHDDMYFLPKWDYHLYEEVKKINHKKFYFSSTQISPLKGGSKGMFDDLQHISQNFGEKIENFKEEELLKNFDKYRFRDLQGSHWAPHLIHKSIWDEIGGFSEEFDPGFTSDPDLNMKLWNYGVRIFKGVSKSRVYHFGSITTRHKKNIVRNKGKRTFLLKWKMTVDFFVKFYLNRGHEYKNPLNGPHKNFSFYINLNICKLKYLLTKYFL